MRRALLAVSIFLAAAACAAAEPAATNAPTDGTVLPKVEPAPTPVAPNAPADNAPAAPAATTADAAAVPTIAPGAEPITTTETAPRPANVAVPQVELRKPTDDTVCHKVRPTGSLISVERCFSRSAVAHSKDSELLHSDLDRIREQENDRQARDAAAAMAGRRIEQ